MKATYLRNYMKNGKPVFVYEVTGTKEQLEAYREAQGEFSVIDDKTGKDLYFTTRGFGKKGKLMITSKGNVAVDLSELHMLNSMAEQFGGVLGQEIVRAGLQDLNGGGTAPKAPEIAPEQIEEEGSEE